MRGTTSALRLLFGLGVGSDYDGEWVYPGTGAPFHIFDGFALVNRLLCFAGPPNSRQGRATREMVHNCRRHLTATLDILQPTIAIQQGKSVSKWTDSVMTPGRTYSTNLREAFLGDHRVLVCSFSHPSARGNLRWGDSLSAPYLTEVVRPTLLSALRRL